MQELFLQSLLLGGADWAPLVSLFAVAFFYYRAPAGGYAASGRRYLALSMWLLVGRLVLHLALTGYVLYQTMPGTTTGAGIVPFRPSSVSPGSEAAIQMLFQIGRGVIFIAALITFVLGMMLLPRPREYAGPAAPRVSE